MSFLSFSINNLSSEKDWRNESEVGIGEETGELGVKLPLPLFHLFAMGDPSLLALSPLDLRNFCDKLAPPAATVWRWWQKTGNGVRLLRLDYLDLSCYVSGVWRVAQGYLHRAFSTT
jgi:hypothetical protein